MKIKLIAHVLIVNRGKILIIKRSAHEKVLPGYWDLPGGSVKDGEDPLVAATREVKEETGLKINKLKLFYHTSNIDKKKNTQFITLIFYAQYRGGKIKLNAADHTDYAWFYQKDIKKFKRVTYLDECLLCIR